MIPEPGKVIWRKDLIEILGVSKRYLQSQQKKGKLPRPDFPPEIGHPGHGGKGPGWFLKTLPKSCQEKIIDSGRIEKNESQVPALISSGPVGLPQEDSPSLPTGQNIERTNVRRLDELSEKARIKVFKWIEFLPLYRENDSGEEKKFFLDRWNAENPGFHVSPRNAHRVEKLEREGGIEELFPRWGEKDSTSTVPDAAFRKFSALWMVQQKPPASEVHRIISHIHPGIPSVAAFMRRLFREYPKHIRFYYREGPQAYDRKYQCYMARDYRTIKPGQIYCMDHHQIDVAVADEREQSFFSWATVCMDIHSRKYLGWHLCKQPNSDSIHLAFRRACLRYGVPKELLIDNGKDFRSLQFTGGARKFRLQIDENATRALIFELGVTPIFANPYNAKSKPIERSFLTVKERFSRLLPTFRGGDVTERPEELQKIIDSGKIVSIGEFEKLYAGFIEVFYNDHPHRGQGMDGRTPNEVFTEENVARKVDERMLCPLLLRSSRPVKVGKNGVTLFDRVYYEDPLLMLKGQSVYVRYDPGQIGRVWVYTMKDEFVCQAEQRELMAWGATEEQFRKAQTLKRKEKALIRSYQQTSYDRSLQPDILKSVIMNMMKRRNINLTMDDIQPEKPLLREMRISADERDRMQEEQEDERRRVSQKIIASGSVSKDKEEAFVSEELKASLGIFNYGS